MFASRSNGVEFKIVFQHPLSEAEASEMEKAIVSAVEGKLIRWNIEAQLLPLEPASEQVENALRHAGSIRGRAIVQDEG